MATPIICDGCGIDIMTMDRINISFGSLETGSVQADLCFPCAEEIRATKIWGRLVAQAAEATAAENARRQQILADQAIEFERRAALARDQEKEANAAMRAAGEV